MATAKQLIEGALRALNVLPSGENGSPDMIQDALTVLKQLLESWSLENLLIPAMVSETFAVDGASYTIGEGLDLDTAKPISIYSVSLELNDITYKITRADEKTFAVLPNKNSIGVPRFYLYRNLPDYGQLQFSMIPESEYTMRIVSLKPLSDVELLAETDFQPGMDRAIRLGLALELAPEYGRNVSQLMIVQYRQAIGVLKRQNSIGRTGIMRLDSAIAPVGERFDINTGL